MYINSPGGSFTAMTAIYDTMQYVRPDIQTVCLGQAAVAAAVLLAAGTPGKRMALPNSRIIIHQPATEGGYGQVSDIEIQAREIMRMRTQLEEMLARHSGQAVEQVRKDIDRDKILTADEAKEYGLVDQVLASRKKSPATASADRLSSRASADGRVVRIDRSALWSKTPRLGGREIAPHQVTSRQRPATPGRRWLGHGRHGSGSGWCPVR